VEKTQEEKEIEIDTIEYEYYYAFRELFAHVKGDVYKARKPAYVLERVCTPSR
jgi:hypothetical protein